MNRRNWITYLVVTTVGASALVGCGGKAPPATTPTSSDSTRPKDNITSLDKVNEGKTLDSKGNGVAGPKDAEKPETSPAKSGGSGRPADAQSSLPAIPAPAAATPAPLFVESKVNIKKYDDGKPKREWHVNVYAGAPDRYEGQLREWWPNGQLWKEGQYKNDKRFGEWKFFSNNGKLAKEGAYNAEGRPDGQWHIFNGDGSKTRDEKWSNGKRNGVWTYYDDTGKKVKRQEEYKDHVWHGTWTSWHPNGQKSVEEHWQEGQRHGILSTWYESGKLKSTREFRNGKQHGKAIELNENGDTISEQEFIDGVPVNRANP